VIATTASKEQIATTAANPRIEFHVATAETSGLPDQSVELITVDQALHWLHFDRLYAQVRRVHKHGGLLVAFSTSTSSPINPVGQL
jgi:ubiquinone/menaquinone biosynthesis C-methylase UbiE